MAVPPMASSRRVGDVARLVERAVAVGNVPAAGKGLALRNLAPKSRGSSRCCCLPPQFGQHLRWLPAIRRAISERLPLHEIFPHASLCPVIGGQRKLPISIELPTGSAVAPAKSRP
jgi:hypothetical protein